MAKIALLSTAIAAGGLQPRRLRPFAEFAEQEVKLTAGPRDGLRFSIDYMPFSGQILKVFDGARYRRFFASGPTQSSKTTLFFIIPILYHLFEIGESVIVGAPTMDLAQGTWKERILPAIRASRFAALLPRKGAGSREGKFEACQFLNGAWLRFMGAGGRDSQRSSFAARIVVITEIDKMDTAAASSREADPVTQLEKRTSAFGDRARIYGECTMSDEQGRIYQEIVEFGTNSRPLFPCPRCGEYVALEREGFVGWQGARDIIEAQERAGFSCPTCSAIWTEADRAAALRRPVIANHEQAVAKDGTVTGEPAKTNTFGIRWSGLASPMKTMAGIAGEEWRGAKIGTDAALKGILQFEWGLPWKRQEVDTLEMTPETVLGKIGTHARGVVPAQTVKLIVAIDLGLWSNKCRWVAVAWTADARGYVIDYGQIRVVQSEKPSPFFTLEGLRKFRDEKLKTGWPAPGGLRGPDLVLVDSGWEPDYVYRFAVESGQARYMSSKGRGSGRNQAAWRAPSTKSSDDKYVDAELMISRLAGDIRLFQYHSDYWKHLVHQGFSVANGAAGSIELFVAPPAEHLTFAKNIAAEQEVEDPETGRPRWDVRSKDNHYLDVTSMARAGAHLKGIRLLRIEESPAPRIRIDASKFRPIRRRY